jgi:hypothetical protein
VETIAHSIKPHSLQSALRARTVVAMDENAAASFMKMNAI